MLSKKYHYASVRATLLLVLLTGLVGIYPAQAESMDLGWAQGWGGPNMDYGTAVAVDNNGNTFGTGFTMSSPSDQNIVITKLSVDGNYVWSHVIGGASGDSGRAITTDPDGNVYVTGAFSGVVDFDSGSGITNRGDASSISIFVMKLNTDGELIWVRSMGGSGYNTGSGIALDRSGNLYVSGFYTGTVDFDPEEGSTELTSVGLTDSFVIKLSDTGNLIWAKSIGGTYGSNIFDIVADENGSVFLTGGFTEMTDFDPGPGVYTINSMGGRDLFVSKLDADGGFVWAETAHGTLDDLGADIVLGPNGDLYFTGFFQNTLSFDSGIPSLTSAGDYDIVVGKVDENGDAVWARRIGAGSPDYGYSLAADTNGYIYVTGQFWGTVDFDPGAGTGNLTSSGVGDAFITKLDQDGDFVWAKKLGGTADDMGEGIAVDNAGYIYLTGLFSNTVDFDLGSSTYNLTSAGNSDIFVTKLIVAPQTYYVHQNATGANNGTSWEDAYTDLQSALAAASGGDEIWVAAGTYKPTTGVDRMISFNLKNGVAVYGGFNGTETLLSQRDFETNVTILSGDIGIVDNNGDNSYHVVVGSNINVASILDGFTITGGNAASTPFVTETGGGIHNTNSSPTLRNLIIDKNSAGIAAGVFNFNSSPTFVDVIFSNNAGTPGSRGGALVNDVNSSPHLTNVTFFNNSADLLGAGMSNSYDSNPQLVNVTFVGNNLKPTNTRGAAIYNWDSNPTLTNVTITGNSAAQGGAIYNDNGSHTTIVNSILYGNIGGEISDYSGTSTVSYSIVQGGYAGTENLDVDPLLGPLQDNGGFTQTMALGSGSPAIDAGDDANCPDIDQRGVARPQGSHCDIGAYEYEDVVIPTPTNTPSPTTTVTPTATLTLTPTSTATPTKTATSAPVAKPGIPVLLLPANGALVNSLRPDFDWKDSQPVAHHYQVQVATNSTFSALVINENNVMISTFTPAFDLVPGKLYHWRVKAFNVNGVGSGWSSVRNFKTPLVQPVPLSPTENESLLTDRATFDWDVVPGATSYILQVSRVENFSTPLINATVNTTAYSMTKDLPQNKMLFWRVRAKTSSVVSPWSAKWMFKTGNPPSVPVLSSPANGVLVRDYTPPFNWSNAALPTGTSFKYYELQVDDNKEFSSPAAHTTTPDDIADSDFTPISDLASNTKFYWRVRAVNTMDSVDHVSGWSPVWSFRTVIAAPTALTVLLDEENLLPPRFTWDNAVGPITGYSIQISTSANFSTLLVNSTTSDTTYTLLKSLPPGKTIHWRVRVNGVNGPSRWTVSQFIAP